MACDFKVTVDTTIPDGVQKAFQEAVPNGSWFGTSKQDFSDGLCVPRSLEYNGPMPCIHPDCTDKNCPVFKER